MTSTFMGEEEEAVVAVAGVERNLNSLSLFVIKKKIIMRTCVSMCVGFVGKIPWTDNIMYTLRKVMKACQKRNIMASWNLTLC